MEKTGNSDLIRFNMQGHLIQLDKSNHRWTWTKWEYLQTSEGKEQVVRQSGGIEFMKIFPSLLSEGLNDMMPVFHNKREMDSLLKKHGVDYIFLYQGETVVEKDFRSVEEAWEYYGLEEYPIWDVTDYWFAFDLINRSWCMYDATTGDMRFDAADLQRRMQKKARPVSRPRNEARKVFNSYQHNDTIETNGTVYH